MKDKYTVVLCRPDYMTSNYGQDIYVAKVRARTHRAALAAAQDEVFNLDRKQGMKPKDPQDYVLCIMFEGHPKPCLFGWSL